MFKNILKPKQKVLIVGLGNIGRKYERNRHNIGFQFLDFFASKHLFPALQEEKKLEAHLSKMNQEIKTIFLAKPITFMNASGIAVKKVSRYFKIETKNIFIIHDDLDLEFGEFKIHKKTPKSHNGLLSISSQFKNDHLEITKIRIGVENREGEKKYIPSKDYVLSNFSLEEQDTLNKDIFPQIMEQLQAFLV